MALIGLSNRYQLKTVRQASHILQISPHTLRAWIADGKVGVVRLGRVVRIQLTEIERLIERGYSPAVEETSSNEMDITDLKESTEDRWLNARQNQKDTAVKCEVCDGHLLPHRNGGWIHLDSLSGPVTHAPVAVQGVKRTN